VVAGLAFMGFAAPAGGQTLVTWTGTGGNANWSTTNNWSAGGPPTTSGTWNLTFTGTNQAVSGTVTATDDIGGTTDTLRINNLAIVATASTAFNLTRGGSRTLTLIDGGTVSTQNSIGSARHRLNVPLTLSGSATFNVASGGNLQLDGGISGGGGATITKSGGGTLFFQSNNSNNWNLTAGEMYFNGGVASGTVTYNGGSGFVGASGNYPSQFIFLTNGQIRSWGGATTVFTSSTFNLPSAAAADVTMALNSASGGSPSEIQGVIQDNTSKKVGVTLTFAGANWRLTGNNTYTGTTNLSVAANLTIGNGGTTGALSPSSVITGSAGATLAFNRSDTISSGTHFNNVIGGAINLTKLGSGTLQINGLNTYSGTTQVSAGQLHVTSSGSINSTASVIVNGAGAELRYNAGSALTKPLTLTQGTLSGTGTLNTAVTVGSNAIHSPGNSPGSQTVQSETWASGGTYLWEVNDWNGAAGTGFDQINVTNTLDVTATSGSTFKLAVTGLTAGNAVGAVPNFSNTARKAFTIATAGSLTNFAGDKLQIDTTSFSGSNSLGNGGFVAGASGNDVTLTFIPSAVYDLAATPNNAVILVGGSSTITAAVTNNTAGRTNPDAINFTGLSLSGGLSPSPASGTGIAAGNSGSGSAVFTGLTSGSFTFTPGIGSVTNATLGTAAIAGGTSAATVTVLDHATSSLAGTLLTSTTISLGSWNYATNAWESGSGTEFFDIFNLAGAGGAALTADLALLSVSGSGGGFTTNLGTYANIAGGQSGQYSISVDPAAFLSSGTQSRTFTISLGDPTNLSGAAASNTLSVTAQVIVVPEPGALALAGAGIGLAGWLVRRRRK
jgi:fibronectin-binding autotransporter adhesin